MQKKNARITAASEHQLCPLSPLTPQAPCTYLKHRGVSLVWQCTAQKLCKKLCHIQSREEVALPGDLVVPVPGKISFAAQQRNPLLQHSPGHSVQREVCLSELFLPHHHAKRLVCVCMCVCDAAVRILFELAQG